MCYMLVYSSHFLSRKYLRIFECKSNRLCCDTSFLFIPHTLTILTPLITPPRPTVVFLTPTRPLVTQQALAYTKLTGHANTAALSGSGPGCTPAQRAVAWQQRQVFFSTPQTLLSDLTRGAVDGQRVVLLVLDEAHRAQGNASYVQVIEALRRADAKFRIVGLSATPGADTAAIERLVATLACRRLAVRSEEDADVAVYLRDRVQHTLTVQLNKPAPVISLRSGERLVASEWRGVWHARTPSAVTCQHTHEVRLCPYSRSKSYQWNLQMFHNFPYLFYSHMRFTLTISPFPHLLRSSSCSPRSSSSPQRDCTKQGYSQSPTPPVCTACTSSKPNVAYTSCPRGQTCRNTWRWG